MTMIINYLLSLINTRKCSSNYYWLLQHNLVL